MKRRRDRKPDSSPPGVAAAEGSSAKLKARDGIDWPVQISGRDGDVLMLVLLAKSEDGVELSDGHVDAADSLMLECTSDHGVVRFPGDAMLEEPRPRPLPGQRRPRDRAAP